MSTEELIQALGDLKDSLPLSENDQILFALEDKMKPFQDRLANNDNYRDTVEQPTQTVETPEPTAEDILYGSHFENGTESNTPETVTNTEPGIHPANIAMRERFEMYRNSIEEANNSIAEDNIALQEAEQALVDKRREFSNIDNDNIDMNSPEYAGQRALLSALESQVEELRNEIEENQRVVNETQAKLDDPNYGSAAFEALMASDPTVNYQARFEDEKALAKIQEQYQLESDSQIYSQSAVNAQIDEWVNQIQSGNYDAAAISAAIDELAGRIAQTSLDEDREAELADIDRQLADNSMELADIQNRLSDRLNYVVSSFEAGSEAMGLGGAYDKRIQKVQKGRDLATGANQKAELDELYKELVANPDRADEINARIKEKRSEMASIANLHKDDVAKFDARIAKLKEEKENVLSHEQLNRINELRGELSGLDFSKDGERVLEISSELNGILGNTTLDVNQMRLDEKREAELLAAKAALENRRELLSRGIIEKLYTIQAGLNNIKTQANQQNSQPVGGTDTPKNKPSLDDLMDGAKEIDPNKPSLDDLMDGAKEIDPNKPSLDELMDGAKEIKPEPLGVTKPLTDEERQANLKKALENDTMRDSWLKRAENEDVYWEQKDAEEQTNTPNNKIKVAGFAAAGSLLKEKAKGMLNKAKEKLAGMKDHFAKHWKKYVVGAAVLIGLVACAKDLGDGKLPDNNEIVQEQDSNDITQETETPEVTPEAETPEDEKDNDDKELNNDQGHNKDNNDNTNNNDNNNNQTQDNHDNSEIPAPAPIIGDPIAVDQNGDEVDLTIPEIPQNSEDTSIISQTTTTSENPEQHVTSETQTTTGGEELYTKTEETTDEVNVDDQGNITETTNTSSSSESSSSTSNTDENGGIQSSREEEVSNDEVLPDLGGGEIVNSEEEATNEVLPDLGGGEIATEETIINEPPVEEKEEVQEQGQEQTQENEHGTFALGSGETYVAPLGESYFQNADMAIDNSAYAMTANEDGTYSVTNTGDEDIQVAAPEREENNNTIDNSDIAADLAALEAELGLDLSIEAPTNDAPTR